MPKINQANTNSKAKYMIFKKHFKFILKFPFCMQGTGGRYWTFPTPNILMNPVFFQLC